MGIREIVALVAGATRAADMIAGWLATYALHSTVWIALAWWLASRRSLRQVPRAQHAVWTTALVAGFVTAAVQLAAGFTPLGGEVRLLDGAREGMAQVRLLVQRAASDRGRLSFGTRLGPPAEWARLPLPPDRKRELVVIRHDVALRTARAREAAGGKAEHTYRFNAGMTLPNGLANGLANGDRLARVVRTLEIVRVTPPFIERDVRIEAALVSTPWSLVIVALWGAGCGLLLLRLRLARARLERTLIGRVDARYTLAGSVLRELAKNAGLKRDVVLTTTDRLGSPAAIPGNEICLPRRVLAELTPLEQESLLAHELAHVIRRDTLWLRVGQLIESVAWFQPLNRIASRRMQLAAEFAADEWAVRMTKEPLRLAKCLALVAGWLTPRSTVLAPAMVESKGSPLLQRVRRLTAPAAAPRAGGRALTPVVLALAGVAIVAVAPSIAVGHSMQGRGAPVGKRHIAVFVVRGNDASFDRRTIVTGTLDPSDPRHADVVRIVAEPNGPGE